MHDEHAGEEWAIRRKHPTLTYCLLMPNDNLRFLVDILSDARIFAVVDVWDALRSDRSYRAAWTEEQARDYLFEQSGRHFDPKVVGVFLSLISEFG